MKKSKKDVHGSKFIKAEKENPTRSNRDKSTVEEML